MRILFVCLGGSCRSPMAAAIARSEGIDAQAAGTNQWLGDIYHMGIQVLAETGVTLEPGKAQRAQDLVRERWTHIIFLDPQAQRDLGETPKATTHTWDIPDPSGRGYEAMIATRTKLHKLITSHLL